MARQDQSLPPYILAATSYTLVAGAENVSRSGTLRESRWSTIQRYSGSPNGVQLAYQTSAVSKRQLHMLERRGLLIFNTSPTTEITAEASQAFTTVEPEDDESRYPEGRESFREHRRLERDGNLPTRAKKERLEQVGHLSCDACGFNFTVVYGTLGSGFIEAHHTVPISTMLGTRNTKLSELALVCSNCHRMLHRGGYLLSVKKLKQLISAAGEA